MFFLQNVNSFWSTGDNQTEVCPYVRIFCDYKVQVNFTNDLMVEQCQCLPDCTSIKYDVEKSVMPYWKEEDDRIE